MGQLGGLVAPEGGGMFEATMSRREVLRRGAAGVAALSTGSLLTAGSAFGRSAATLETVRWISPRGTLQVMDDFNLWVPDQDGVLQDARDRGEADRRLRHGRARVHEVRRPEQGRHGLPVAGRADRVDRQRHGRQVGLGRDLGSGLQLRPACEQHDQVAEGAEGQVDRARQLRLEGDRRPDARRARHRPEVRPVRVGGLVVDAGRRDGQGRRRARLGRAPRPARRPGPQAEVPDRHEVVEASVERVLGPGLRPRGRGEAGPLHALPPGRRHGPRVHEGEPAGGRPDHLPLAARPAEDAQAAARARLDARARARVRHEPSQGPGLGLQRREGLGQLPQGRQRPRPDEEAPRDEGRVHERAAGGREPEGRRRPGAQGREGVQARQGLREDEGRGPASRCSRSVSGRPRSAGRPTPSR